MDALILIQLVLLARTSSLFGLLRVFGARASLWF
jgi:hypothetical protein